MIASVERIKNNILMLPNSLEQLHAVTPTIKKGIFRG